MTAAKEHADVCGYEIRAARNYQAAAEQASVPHMVVWHAQHAALSWTQALISLLRFVDALPEPVAIPPVPQPSEETRRRGMLVGAIVRDVVGGVGRVVSHGAGGLPLIQWGDTVTRCGTDHLTVIRPAPAAREPSAEARKRGLYIGARVDTPNVCNAEIIAWDGDGNPVVEPDDDLEPIGSWLPEQVTLAGDAS